MENANVNECASEKLNLGSKLFVFISFATIIGIMVFDSFLFFLGRQDLRMDSLIYLLNSYPLVFFILMFIGIKIKLKSRIIPSWLKGTLVALFLITIQTFIFDICFISGFFCVFVPGVGLFPFAFIVGVGLFEHVQVLYLLATPLSSYWAFPYSSIFSLSLFTLICTLIGHILGKAKNN